MLLMWEEFVLCTRWRCSGLNSAILPKEVSRRPCCNIIRHKFEEPRDLHVRFLAVLKALMGFAFGFR